MCATTKYVSETWMSIGTAPSMIPERPPMTNIDTKPSAHNMGVVKCIRPSHIVASHEKTLIPVGTAISSVVTIMGTRSQLAIPATNMWCAHTEKPRIRIASRLKAMRDRWALAPAEAQARGDEGNRRLHARWVKFIERRKRPTIANVAIARELAGW